MDLELDVEVRECVAKMSTGHSAGAAAAAGVGRAAAVTPPCPAVTVGLSRGSWPEQALRLGA